MKTGVHSILLLVALCVGAFALAGCGPDYTTPEGTVKAFHKAMDAEDKEAAKRCMVKAEREEKKEEGGNVTVTKKEGDKGTWSVGTATITGDKAKVPVTYVKDGKSETANYVCIQEEGEWRISMMATIFGALADGFKGETKK
ncbi:MAG: DUF4878 domain-containing protein [Planctomycetes bacterium]|nr:DUF4878 domain-containing protein [Planctomycetota bacterium]